MSDFRENYFKARDLIAKELIDKYNLVESYKDDNRLTLDSTNYSIHLTFYIPDGDDVSISERGKQPGQGRNFMYFIFDRFPTLLEAEAELKRIFSDSSKSKEINEYSIQRLETSFSKKIQYLQENFNNYFV